MQPSDEQLMQAYQDGALEALQELFERYRLRMFRFCLGLLGNRADAEDVAAEAFFVIIETPERFDPAQRFSTWAYAIAHHKCVSRLRARRRLVLHAPARRDGDPEDAGIEELPDLGDPIWVRLSREDRARLVRCAINRLPEEHKAALLLRQDRGLSYAEISGVLNCTLAKVKILLFRAKEQLRRDLAPLLKEERQ